MAITVHTAAGQTMYEVLRDIVERGCCDRSLLAAARQQPGYRFYFAFHDRLGTFDEEQFEEMICSLADPHWDPARVSWPERLLGVRERFAQGLSRLEVIESCLVLIESLPAAVWEETETRARSVLPDSVDLSTNLYYIFDGFNTGTAFDGNMSMDLLACTPNSIRRYDPEVVAHELHHIGYAQVRGRECRWAERFRTASELQRLALRLLDTVLSEGIAHYYFTPEDTAAWTREVFPAETAEKLTSALKLMYDARARKLQEFLEAMTLLLAGEEVSVEEGARLHRSFALSEGDNPFPWGHLVGSLMIETIGRVRDREAVIEIILKPQLFLGYYEEARKQLGCAELPAVPPTLQSTLEHWLA